MNVFLNVLTCECVNVLVAGASKINEFTNSLKMYSNEHTLQELLSKAYHRLDMDEWATEVEVRTAYKAVVGDWLSKLTLAAKYDKGTLTLRLASAALKQELFYRRSSLAERINDTLGRQAVHKIVIL